MYREFFAQSDLLMWPLIALGIFFTTYMVVLIRTAIGFHKRQRLDHLADLPLESDGGVVPADVREGRA